MKCAIANLSVIYYKEDFVKHYISFRWHKTINISGTVLAWLHKFGFNFIAILLMKYKN